MKTENRFVVREVVKFGLLFGYVVYDKKEKKTLPYEFGEHEKQRAESKAELQEVLYK